MSCSADHFIKVTRIKENNTSDQSGRQHPF